MTTTTTTMMKLMKMMMMIMPNCLRGISLSIALQNQMVIVMTVITMKKINLLAS